MLVLPGQHLQIRFRGVVTRLAALDDALFEDVARSIEAQETAGDVMSVTLVVDRLTLRMLQTGCIDDDRLSFSKTPGGTSGCPTAPR